MRNWHLLILLLVITCCNNPVSTPGAEKNTSAPKNDFASVKTTDKSNKSNLYTLETASKADFELSATRQTVSFIMGPEEARKVNGVLVLKINNKWTSLEAFRDTLLHTDDPAMREYRYLGQHAQINHYLVAGRFYEAYETYLVNKTTGTITTTWTEPVVSPGQKYLANSSFATILDEVPNGIQIWKVTETEKSPVIEKFLEIAQQHWEPFELHWESPNSILIKMIPINKYELLQAEPKEDDFSYLRLRIK